MKKLGVWLILLLIALPISGLFGVVHDQLSYTISSEYFTKFKFLQFGLTDSPLPVRACVAIIGFLASWWMGIPIGLLVGSVALIHRSASDSLKRGLQSYGIIVCVTALSSVAGLSLGFIQTTTLSIDDYRGWFIPKDVVELRRFLCVGYMHNAAYLGGVAGIVAAWVFHLWVRLRLKSDRTKVSL